MLGGSLEKVLAEAIRRVTGRFKTDLMILHGSYAKGTYIEGYSDVDILVVSDDFKEVDPLARIGILADLLAGLDKPVEALAYTRDEFLREIRSFNPLVLDALEYGIPLIKTVFYDEALKEFGKLK
ncbi:MAG: nucleotidyltransferase domain-containing protein [Candidatus Bathyarchaeota archaeon]|nr:nucleotidyltransferase domain-containing protein [Candidatus Bathyarchaeota archaeon]